MCVCVCVCVALVVPWAHLALGFTFSGLFFVDHILLSDVLSGTGAGACAGAGAGALGL